MRKIIVLMLTTSLLMGGCSSSAPSQQNVEKPAVEKQVATQQRDDLSKMEEERQQKEAEEAKRLEEMKNFKYLYDEPSIAPMYADRKNTSEWDCGYRGEAKVFHGDWIRGDDYEMIEKAWRSIHPDGGVGLGIPSFSKDLMNGEYTDREGIMMFLVLYAYNTTEGYHITEDLNISFHLNGTVWYYDEERRSQFYAGSRGFTDYTNGRFPGAYGVSISVGVRMVGDTCGPLCIAIGIGGLFTPNNPEVNVEKYWIDLNCPISGELKKDFNASLIESEEYKNRKASN